MAGRPDLRVAVRNALTRIWGSLRTERAAFGLVGAALLGYLCEELGFWAVIGWDFSIYDILIFAAVGALGSSFGRFVRALWIADVVLLGFTSLIQISPVMSGFTARWVRADSLPSGGVDAVVVLSSSVTSGATLHVSGSDRLLAGADLVRRGLAPRLITTRVSGAYPNITSDADQRRLIELAGVADRWILVPDHMRTTRDEMLVVRPRLRELGARRIAVVTSPLHTRRACATFERDGVGVTCVPALERSDQTRAPRYFLDRLAAFRGYLYERVGWWVYDRRGWVNAG